MTEENKYKAARIKAGLTWRDLNAHGIGNFVITNAEKHNKLPRNRFLREAYLNYIKFTE